MKFFYNIRVVQSGHLNFGHGVFIPQGLFSGTKVLKQGQCAFKNQSELRLDAVCDSRTPEISPQGVCVPMKTPQGSFSQTCALSGCSLSYKTTAQVEGKRYQINKGISLKFQLKNLGTNRKCRVFAVSA